MKFYPQKIKKTSSTKTATPLKVQDVSGLDLLPALEPIVLKGIPLADDPKYARWLLGCLRKELEKAPKTKATTVKDPFSYGNAYWMNEGVNNAEAVNVAIDGDAVANPREDYFDDDDDY